MLAAELDVREVTLLRGYCKYLQQVGVTYSQAYMERVLALHPVTTRMLVELFHARFDPEREIKSHADAARRRMERDFGALATEYVRSRVPTMVASVLDSYIKPRAEQVVILENLLSELFEQVSSLDEDRILRAFEDSVRATVRTNHYQRLDGKPKDYLSFKFDSSSVPGMPKPVPYREIFVYSTRVEGVHLRMGTVARGGLRWSDRREDFRTEVLGLMKAQQVKNTVIVPVGAKGGFYVKQPPAAGDRDAVLAEGVACYRTFIRGLLDITDNIVDGALVPPDRVVRHDADDPYLVVAADKGTATFSDIANALSQEYGFWLDDAFASGGSKGYDHKKMGITAKGGWESVKRHFRAIGKDCQSEDFTCVGIGDMSGDVFGNGMLLSRKIRLLAAFDHRHIFFDPNPDSERSFRERERLFALPRSSWADYDASLISAGGGIYPRSAKFIPITPEVRAALGIEGDVTQLAPADAMRAILQAPVELLWNGGIGVYVKASGESHDACGDRANNALRVNGGELRCRIVGEGGNLGLTQRGRIEFAQAGGLLNTDFIDNSAGVDTSDHEVNIKILLNTAIELGQLTLEQRDELLVAMTDEVERLVLFDNYRQNLAISLMQELSVPRLGSMQHFVRTLEQQGLCSTSCARWSSRACSTGRWSSCRPTSSSRSARPRARACRDRSFPSCCRTRRSCCSSSCSNRTFPRTSTCRRNCRSTSRRRCASASPRPWRSTACAARSSPPRSPIRSSTAWARPSSCASPRTPARAPPRSPKPSPSPAKWCARASGGRRWTAAAGYLNRSTWR